MGVMTQTRNTPRRSIRIPDTEWQPAKATAARCGDSLSDVVRKALRAYVRRNKEVGIER